jgi:putative transposase
LSGYDYSAKGTYFVTICAQDRACLFRELTDAEMRLNPAGRMVQETWDELPSHYAGISVDAFVVMPNHIHGIIVLVGHHAETTVGAGPCACPVNAGTQNDGQPQGVAPTLSLPAVVHRFKTLTTRRYVDGVRRYGWPAFRRRLWQRNYHEHIVRNESSLNRMRDYIANNPQQWESDRENPAVVDLKSKHKNGR